MRDRNVSTGCYRRRRLVQVVMGDRGLVKVSMRDRNVSTGCYRRQGG